MFNEQDLAEGSAGLIGADLIRPILDQIRPSNPIMGRGEPLVQATPAAANPDDVPGIEQPPQVGIEPMGLAPMDTPPRWDIDSHRVSGRATSTPPPSVAKVIGGGRPPVLGIAWQKLKP